MSAISEHAQVWQVVADMTDEGELHKQDATHHSEATHGRMAAASTGKRDSRAVSLIAAEGPDGAEVEF